MSFERNDTSRDATRTYYFGKPNDIIAPINFGFERYVSNADNNEKFIEVARDIDLNNLQFFEPISYTLIEDTKFIRKTKED